MLTFARFLDEPTLRRHQQLYGDTRSVGVRPAFWLLSSGAILALVVFVLAAAFVCRRWNRRHKTLGGSGRERRSCGPCDDLASAAAIKINDGSVAVSSSRGNDDYWPESGMPPYHLAAANGCAPQLSSVAHLAMSPRMAPHCYHHAPAANGVPPNHACCPAAAAAAAQNAAVFNAYGTALRAQHPHAAHPHYSGPYLSSSSTLSRGGCSGGGCVGGGDEVNSYYHYAQLPNGLPPASISALMAYEADDPSPYASTTIASNGAVFGGPQPPSCPIPPPPAAFAHSAAAAHFHHHHSHAPGTNSIRRARTPRTNPHYGASAAAESPLQRAPPPSHLVAGLQSGGDVELSKILAQVRPPLTYDSVVNELAVPNFDDEAPPMSVAPSANSAFSAPTNRVLNSRSPPRTSRSAFEAEERSLLT